MKVFLDGLEGSRCGVAGIELLLDGIYPRACQFSWLADRQCNKKLFWRKILLLKSVLSYILPMFVIISFRVP